jgi:hypothetical protein
VITKLATFRGISQQGDPLNWLFRPDDGLEKVAGVLMPGIQQWLRSYTKKPEELVVLVNAMGASEYWGQNINGDIFFEDALLHDCRQHSDQQHPYDDFTGKVIPPYGYWTFLNALPFVHHKNKDPNRAFGKVAFACWNPKMRRVELIVVLNKTLAMENGGQDVIDKIEAGEYPDVSMGCKVPYDVCAVCGNKSKTRDDYCSCVKNIGMGKILDDGRRIGVINPHPRFFDISFVFIGADKTAKVMAKLATAGMPQSVVDADYIYDTRAICGARDCRDCSGGCKVKAAHVEKTASILSFTDRALENERDEGNLKLTLQDFNRIGNRFGIDGDDLADALIYDDKLDEPNWPSSRPEQIQVLTSFARELEDPFAKKAALSTTTLRTLMGAGAGTAGGAIMGATGSNEGQKALGAAAGAGVGGLLGAGAGYGVHRLIKGIAGAPSPARLSQLKDSVTHAGAAHSSAVDELKGAELAYQNAREAADQGLKEYFRQPVPVTEDAIARTRRMLESKDPLDLDDFLPRRKFPTVAEAEADRLFRVQTDMSAREFEASRRAQRAKYQLEDALRDDKMLQHPLGHAAAGAAGAGAGAVGGMGVGPLLPYKEHERPYEESEKTSSLSEDFEKLRSHKPAYRQLSDRDLFEMACKGRLNEVFPSDPQDSGLMMSRLDNQENPQGSRSDGTLRTNYSQAEEEKLSFVSKESSTKREALTGGGIGAAAAATGVGILSLLKNKGRIPKSFLKEVGEAAIEGAIGGGVGSGLAEALKTKKPSSRKFTKPRAPKPQHKTAGVSDVFGLAKGMKIGPPPARNRKEFPFVGTINFRGLMVHVENKPGDVREGVGEDGKRWRTEMKLPYGEILGTKGTDGDKVDVYVGPYRDAPNVYIVHQNKVKGPDAGKYDEDKVMIGFLSPDMAKEAYLAHYDNTKFFRSITTMSFSLFKRVIDSGEVDGEKVATVLHKVAAETHLDELFSGAASARRRHRVWKDAVTGKEHTEVGSGLQKETDEANKTKEASAQWDTLLAEFGVQDEKPLTPPSPSEILKLGSGAKIASHSKWAELVKEIGPSKAVGRVSPLLSEAEPSLPKDTLNEIGAGPDLKKGLSTLSIMGMVLKPEEFQRIALNHLGKGGLADELENAGITFKSNGEEVAPCESLSAVHSDPELLKALMPLLGEKSYFGPIVRRRIIRVMVIKPKPKDQGTTADSPLLSKVAGAYTWYRREMMKVAATEAPFAIPNMPMLHGGIYELGDADMYKGAQVSGRTAAVVMGSVPLSLMYSAHLRSEAEQQPLGFFSQLVANHPWLTALGVAAGLRELLKSPRGAKAVDMVFAAAQKAWEGKQLLLRA